MNRIFPTLVVLSWLTLSSTAFAQTASAAAAEIVNTDESPRAIPAPPATPATAATQGPQIAPTPAQLQLRQQRAKEAARQQALKAKADAEEAARQQALKAKVDALQAEVTALKNGEPIRQVQPTRVPQPAAPHSQARGGVWLNAGLGFGSLGCNGCEVRLSGTSGGLSVGTTISDRLLLGVGTTGYYRSIAGSVVNAGTLDARLRFYPVRTSGFFLTGGMGLGSISVDNETEFGVGAVLGLGWDIRVRPNMSLTPFWTGIGIGTSSGGGGYGQLGLGITVH